MAVPFLMISSVSNQKKKYLKLNKMTAESGVKKTSSTTTQDKFPSFVIILDPLFFLTGDSILR